MNENETIGRKIAEDENETIGRKIAEKVKSIAGQGAIGLLSAAVGFVGVIVFDSYIRVSDHDSQFSRVWTPEFHRQITSDLDDVGRYIAQHEAYRSLYSEQDKQFKADVRAALDVRDQECRANWTELSKRLREVEQLTAILNSRLDQKSWSLTK